MNSISSLMEPADIIAEIRMERQAFGGVFVLFEGSTDVRRFDKFFDPSLTSSVTCWGRKTLLGVVEALNGQGQNDFLALTDADFDHFFGCLADAKNLIYSQFHDFDIDVIQTEVLERYLAEVGDRDLCEVIGDIEEIRFAIADAIRPLTSAKIANQLGLINCGLSDLNWSSCFDGTALNKDRLAYLILKKTTPKREHIDALVEIIDGNMCFDEIWQATNGHDFSETLGLFLRSRIGRRKHAQTTSDEIERHLRLALSDRDFKSMAVYREIIAWENKSGMWVLQRHLTN
jgi:hypothetical protein